MSFYLKKKSYAGREPRKRKEEQKKPVNKKVKFNDDISSESEIDDDEPSKKRKLQELEDEELIEETPQERKLRLAKKYLEEIEQEEKERLEAQEVDQAISDRLKPDVGDRQIRCLADDYLPIESTNDFKYLKNAHKLSITCIVVSPNGLLLFSGGKDGRLVKWSLPDGNKLFTVKEGDRREADDYEGHTYSVSCIAISSDGKYLASSDLNPSGVFLLWNPESMSLLHKFHGHRKSVTGLAFRRATSTLYSCSQDRSIKVWDAEELSYAETLFGHDEAITSIDSLIRERCLTSGGRDSTLRLWKIPEESQLVFQSTVGQSVDVVKFLNEQHFVSGGEDGSISLWGLMKKKPLYSMRLAHGQSEEGSPNWVISLAALNNSDVFASGSIGLIKLWKLFKDFKRFEVILEVKITGFANSLDWLTDGDYLVVGVGQEHRLGRWWKVKDAKNNVVVLPMRRKAAINNN